MSFAVSRLVGSDPVGLALSLFCSGVGASRLVHIESSGSSDGLRRFRYRASAITGSVLRLNLAYTILRGMSLETFKPAKRLFT